ncbi:MAG: hypothetical protein IT548_09405 [Alphaproteobacteria bacterium]|nr:hypothetical protein [Alphaproteobacteria bacterium]
MLIHLLKEVERELRIHERAFAANLVHVAVSAIASDLERRPDGAPPPPRRAWVM